MESAQEMEKRIAAKKAPAQDGVKPHGIKMMHGTRVTSQRVQSKAKGYNNNFPPLGQFGDFVVMIPRIARTRVKVRTDAEETSI
jgi:hypothetical protein